MTQTACEQPFWSGAAAQREFRCVEIKASGKPFDFSSHDNKEILIYRKNCQKKRLISDVQSSSDASYSLIFGTDLVKSTRLYRFCCYKTNNYNVDYRLIGKGA